jgi:D-alanine-D-alanine ligase
MKKRVGVIFGGRSGEHEISIRSARTVLEQIDKERYEVVPIAISPEGKWLDKQTSLELLPQSTRAQLADSIGILPDGPIVLPGDTSFNGLTVFTETGRNNLGLDVVFPVMHGTFGEDGTIQGLLEMAGLPYVGCGVLASACGMDKVVMKTLFREAGLPICRHVWFLRSEWESDGIAVISRIEQTLGYPCFVKPANLGSSVGVSRAVDANSLIRAFDEAALYDRRIIVEEAVDGREIECAVLGNDLPQASLPGEYIIRNDDKKFLDYTEKYSGTGNNEFVVPSPIMDDLTDRIRSMAIRAFKAIDGSGLSRVDFFLRNDTGELLINEINTMPGLTDASGYPKMWAASGKAFPQVIDELIDFAFQRAVDRSRSKTTRL